MIIVDGNMLAHRAFHKLDFLKNLAGVHTGMEYGFLRSLESLVHKYPEHRIIICFDTAKNRKRKEGGRYKANRSTMKSAFYERLGELQKFLLNFWDLAWQEGEEADDVMYSLAKSCYDTGQLEGEIYLYSNDNDLLQCVTDKIFVLKSHESALYVWDADKVEDKYGLLPDKLVLFRSFVGDPSDNLCGVERIQKRILVEAIMSALDAGWEEPEHIAEYVIDYSSWSPAVLIKLHKFSRSEMWRENYELMKLEQCEFQYFTSKMNKEHVIKKLKEWEIGSLDICKEFANELIDANGEF